MESPRPPPELIVDATAEILLRIPPDEPAHLVRASLVCKLWIRILTDPAFLRRYRRFHRAPPLLGFFHDIEPIPTFVSTTAATPLHQPPLDRASCSLDCRHGRVLFRRMGVWDPITGCSEELAVLCLLAVRDCICSYRN